MFDAAFDPVLTVNSGDSVTVDCVSGGVEVMPPPGSPYAVPPALQARLPPASARPGARGCAARAVRAGRSAARC